MGHRVTKELPALADADDATYVSVYREDWITPEHAQAREAGRLWLFREFAVASAVVQAGAVDVVDVGCADGYLALLMARLGLRVSVMDCVQEAVEHATSLAKAVSAPIDGAWVGLAEEIAGTGLTWDAVTCTETIEHVRDPARVVRALAAAARKVVIFTTPVADGYDDPLHLHHWEDETELRAALGLNEVFRSNIVAKLPSRWGDEARVFLAICAK